MLAAFFFAGFFFAGDAILAPPFVGGRRGCSGFEDVRRPAPVMAALGGMLQIAVEGKRAEAVLGRLSLCNAGKSR